MPSILPAPVPVAAAVDPSASGAATLLPQLSAVEVHKNIMRCHLLRHRVDRKLLDWLRILVENRYESELGASSPAQYIIENLKYEKSEAGRIVDVVEAMHKLPRSLDAFEAGRISMAHMKALALVAGKDQEEAWLAFALEHKARELLEEVETGRSVPRKRRYGIPNRTVALTFRMTRALRELARKALEKWAARMMEARKPGEPAPAPEEVLLDICRRILAAEFPGKGASEREKLLYDLVVMVCPECHEKHLLSKEGPIEVDDAFVESIEGVARRMEIGVEEMVKGEALDPGEEAGEVPEEVARKVLALFDHSCARCGTRLDLHVHHILFRQNGGTNALFNLVPACRGCHGHYAQSDVMTSNLTYPLEVASSPPRLTLHNILPGCPVGSAATRAGRGTGDRADEALGPGMWTSTAVRDWEVHFAGNYAQLFSAETFAGKEFGKRLGITSDCA